MSTKNAGLAKKLGYTNIRIYLEGEPAWKKTGHPTFASNDFVAKGNIVLVDLRSIEKSTEGRIARSVTIPYDTLADTIEDIPTKAPVVLYSDNNDDVMDALEDLRDEGYKRVSLVYGNIDGWSASGGEIVKGDIISEIDWVRKLGKGEVSLDEFNNIVESNTGDKLILDVRTKDEVTSGMFTGAVNIPLDEIGKRMGELPKDKEMLIHCSTGARAEMAYQELKKADYKSRFLMAEVECEEGSCEAED